MPEPAGWRLYPVGPAASLVRAAGSALMSIPLIALLMIAPFLTTWYVAERGAFGVGATGQAWSDWAELAAGLATLAFAAGIVAIALLTFVRTILMIGSLRRAVRRGAPGVDVPHPQQWLMVTDWSGASLIIASLITTAVLAFPGLLTRPVRAWVEDSWVREPTVLVALPVAAIVLVIGYRLWRKAPLRELEGRWTEDLRSAAAEAASARVPVLPTDADGDVIDPSTLHRRRLDAVGDRINSAGLIITVVTVVVAAVALTVGSSVSGSSGPSTTLQAFILLAPVLLLGVAIVCFVIGGVLQNCAQFAELHALLATARRPYGPEPELGALARYWRPMGHPWVDFLGLLGALLLLLAVPALLLTDPAAARWGAAGGMLAAASVLAAVVVDVAAEHVTSQARSLVMRRWPIPDPSTMNKKAQRDDSLEADVERYGQDSGAGQYAAMTAQQYQAPPYAPPSPGTPPPPANGPYPAPPANGPYPAPPANGPYPAPPANGPYPAPPANGPYPSPPVNGPYPPPAPQGGARRAWGLPKKLRSRGLGDLYR